MGRNTARFLITCTLALGACSDPLDGDGGGGAPPDYRGYLAHTFMLGQSDNAEVVKVIGGTRTAVVVASKGRKLVLVRVVDDQIQEARSRTLFDADTTESELTHVDVSSDGSWAVLTRTLIDKDATDATVDCRGELVFVDVTDTVTFGDVLSQVPVGPMPDAVDIADDNQHVVSANERDVVWGKCDGLAGLEAASISIIDTSGGPAAATETARVIMGDVDSEREPESVIFSADNDLVVATLQDSHEVALLRLSALAGIVDPTSADVQIVALPQDSLGRDPWPDGVTRFVDAAGGEHFAIAGEANDTLIVVDGSGTVVANVDVRDSDIPADFPRDGSWGPLFQPDSVSSFAWQGNSYLALSLKAAGAIGVWDTGDAMAPRFISAVKVGQDELARPGDASSIAPEGVSASSSFGFVLTANEGESSVSLVLPEP